MGKQKRIDQNRMKYSLLYTILLTILCAKPVLFAQPSSTSSLPVIPVFQAGEDGYRCFRIPAVVCSPQGLLLSFAEGRLRNCGDFGDVDIVLKTSADGGQTWSPLQVIVDYDSLQAGNPAPVFDLLDPAFPAGRLFLFYNTGNAPEHALRQGQGHREVWYISSEDAGKNWSVPTNITAQVHRPGLPIDLSPTPDIQPQGADWRAYANTPGHALQLDHGRIFVPANHSSGDPQAASRDYRAHAYFSDDHGSTFRLSPDVDYPGSNESTAARLPGGGVLMSVRNESGDAKYRLLARSLSGGEAWDSTWIARDLPDPVYQGSLLNVVLKNGLPVLLHSNPASQTKRCCLSVKISKDAGMHWELLREIYPGSAAYSDLVSLNAVKVGVLFEGDDYSKIYFAAFELE